MYQIKILVASKVALVDSDSNSSPRVSHKNKSSDGVFPNLKQQGKKTTKHKGYHNYCVVWKKAVMPECKYKWNTS